MDLAIVFNFVSEILYFLVVFGLVFLLSAFRGYQSVIDLIMGLYLSLLLYFNFPNIENILSHFSGMTLAVFQFSLFAIMTFFTTALCSKLLPDRARGGYFEHFFKKIILSFGATVLIMSFSFQVLPITDFVVAGTPLQLMFGSEASFFWWLLLPFVVLYVV